MGAPDSDAELEGLDIFDAADAKVKQDQPAAKPKLRIQPAAEGGARPAPNIKPATAVPGRKIAISPARPGESAAAPAEQAGPQPGTARRMRPVVQPPAPDPVPGTTGRDSGRLSVPDAQAPAAAAPAHFPLRAQRDPSAPEAPPALSEEQRTLARVLLACGPLTAELVEEQLQASGKAESSVGKALRASGYPAQTPLLQAMLASYRIPKLNVANIRLIPEVRDLVSADVARRLQVVPIDRVGKILILATPDLYNLWRVEELRAVTGYYISLVQCDEQGLHAVLSRYYPDPPKLRRLERQREVEVAGLTPLGRTVYRAIPLEKGDAPQGRPLGAFRQVAVKARFQRLYASRGPVLVEEVLM